MSNSGNNQKMLNQSASNSSFYSDNSALTFSSNFSSSVNNGSIINFDINAADVTSPTRFIVSSTLNSAQFKIIALKYKENISKINQKMENYKSKNKKKLFSIYRVFDNEKKDYISMMHVYKRNLTPVKENFQQSNSTTPYENNFLVFS